MVRYAVEIARSLRARPDVELHVLALKESQAFFADLLGGADRVSALPGSLPTVARSLLERTGAVPALQRPWDVVHGCKHIVPRSAHGRRVLTVHDMLILDRPGDYPRLKRLLLPGRYVASLRGADVILCVSEATRARLLAYLPEIAARVHVVPHAVSPALRRARPQPVPALSGRQFALVVGDLSPRKNVGFVLRIWREVAARRPGALLALVGPDGWGITGGGTSGAAALPDVALLGHRPEAQLRWCYENAAIVLCPSVQEGFGLPALEGVDLGATVVTSTDPALVEASGDLAIHLPVDDPAAWTAAILDAFAGRGAAPIPSRPRRTWHTVAAETVAAVRGQCY